MPPRISPDRGVPKRGHSSRGGHPGGASRGSQFGGSSSIDTGAATPHETPDSNQTNHPTAFRGQPSGRRGRGGRGAGRGGVPGSPSSTGTAIRPVVTAPIAAETTTASISQSTATISTHSNPQAPSPSSRGQFSPGNRGRGRGRGTSRGGAPGTPSSMETTPATPITGETASSTSFPHSATRGQSFRGRGGYRGSARGSPFDSPSPFRGHSYRGGIGGGFVAGASGPSHTTGSQSGIPGKSFFEKFYQLRISKFLLHPFPFKYCRPHHNFWYEEAWLRLWRTCCEYNHQRIPGYRSRHHYLPV